jgi:hypothetical protein
MLSGMIIGPARFSEGSIKVLMDGSPAVRLAVPITHNQTNAMSAALAPGLTVVRS